jgi:flagellar M-ring protein FliF
LANHRQNVRDDSINLEPFVPILISPRTPGLAYDDIPIHENLIILTGTDPWAIFDKERCTITDFEQRANFRRAYRQMITDRIKAIDDVDDANVTITYPEQVLFHSEQNPVTASVIITSKSGSDITRNPKKIEDIQKLLKTAVGGLQDENIIITDNFGFFFFLVFNEEKHRMDTQTVKETQG